MLSSMWSFQCLVCAMAGFQVHSNANSRKDIQHVLQSAVSIFGTPDANSVGLYRQATEVYVELVDNRIIYLLLVQLSLFLAYLSIKRLTTLRVFEDVR